jgi:ABC-2 type transport system permease protein
VPTFQRFNIPAFLQKAPHELRHRNKWVIEIVRRGPRRSKITVLTAIGFLILPLAGGLFMVILKDPEQARGWGLISTKAQITAGVADWPSFFSMISEGIAAGGAILFALITAWVFGRELSDHTAKELMALATPR